MMIRRFRSFCAEDGSGGNPAAVAFNVPPGDDDRWPRYAATNRIELTAVVEGTDPQDVRFFAPSGEYTFCGHGTLAAAVGSFSSSSSWKMKTRWGMVSGRVIDGPLPYAEYVSDIGPAREVSGEHTLRRIERALGLPAGCLSNSDVAVAGAPRAKTVVRLPPPLSTRSVSPVESALLDACRACDSTGIYVFSVETSGVIFARHFPAVAGAGEDPATGNGVVALLSAASKGRLTDVHSVSIHQGFEMGQPCLLRGALLGDHIVVGGYVATDGEEP